MLGIHRMKRDGIATVVSCELRTSGLAWSTIDAHGHHTDSFALVLDVAPDGGAPFRAEATASFALFHIPSPGDTLRVRCDPDHRAVHVDIAGDPRFDPSLFRPAEAAERARAHEALLDAPPGSGDAPRDSSRAGASPGGLTFDPTTGLRRADDQPPS